MILFLVPYLMVVIYNLRRVFRALYWSAQARTVGNFAPRSGRGPSNFPASSGMSRDLFRDHDNSVPKHHLYIQFAHPERYLESGHATGART